MGPLHVGIQHAEDWAVNDVIAEISVCGIRGAQAVGKKSTWGVL